MEPNCIILYVDSPEKSAAFYTSLLEKDPIENSPTFAMFTLASGVMLGLWSKHTVEPAAITTGGGTELAFEVKSKACVLEVHAEWQRKGLPILQEPVAMDFGFTFVALDPDGHRLRVCTMCEG